MGFLDNAGLGTLWGKIVGKSVPYGYCTTGAGTRAKVVTVSPAITELTAGVQIAVKFQYANSASTTSNAVTLNVNGLGAKEIKRYGSTNISNSNATSWNANSVVILTYDGSFWQLTDYNNTTYSGMTSAEVTAGTGTSNRVITPARLKEAIQHWDTEVSWSQDVTTGTKIGSITIDGTSTDVYAPSGGMSRESDPIFTASPAYGITSTDITNWNSAEANVNADWNATSGDAQILNKPTIPTKTSDLTNDSGFITSYTETDPVFTASPAHGITANDITNWNGKSDFSGDYDDLTNKPNIPTVSFTQGSTDTTIGSGSKDLGTLTINGTSYNLSTRGLNTLDLIENLQANEFKLSVSGTSASLLHMDGTSASIYTLGTAYLSVAGCRITQVLSGSGALADFRWYEVAEIDSTASTATLVCVEGNTMYVAELSATDALSPLTGTFSSQTIGTLTTETDPTVPAWAKESTKPGYWAEEIGFDNTQQVTYITAQDVNGALTDLDSAIDNLEHDVSTIGSDYLSKTGGTITGDLTLKSNAGTNSKSVIFQRGTLTDNYNDWQIQDRGGFLYFDQRGTNSSSFSNQVCFNTSGNVQATTFNGYSLAGASAKAVDTSISSGTTSTNLPTSQAVASYVEGMIGAGFGADEISFSGGQYYIQDLDDDTNLEQVVGTIDTYIWQSIMPNILPSVSASDNGKVLRVVNGAWSAVALPSASGVSF